MGSFKRLIWLRSILLFAGTSAFVWLLFKGEYLYGFLLLPLVFSILAINFRSQVRAYKELEEFAEAAHYRDFTRNFPLSLSRKEVLPLRRAFNDINAVFRQISSERETQYQYLQTILQIVDTAIISYDARSGKVMWINDSFKQLFGIPYLHHFEGLKKRNPDAFEKSTRLVAGQKAVLSLKLANGEIKVQASTAAFITSDGNYKLIAFQNINEAIDATETQAWQKLLSVLTHEIMNSIAPISSLADTLKTRLQTLPQSEELDDIRLGTETIKRRSDGLLQFASTYRSLNKISNLNRQTVFAAKLFENLYQLMEPSLQQKNIALDIILKEPLLQVNLDVNLIEQVLINLLLNAIEAVKEMQSPQINLSAEAISGQHIIQVSDNGKGIPPEIYDSIFIPFFTTRKNGSGVGLTLSKQIMLLHKGNITVQSQEGKGTIFTLSF
ncbi:Histidine kinase-, DNA gyrase B-, and HSP90-like ATPase [bacterium A37T11]|nr:Histidine kinase-, DNA gyrase B-, and HSP90-like ATPase [bacterium A37T11]